MLLAFLSVAGQAAPSWQRIDATVDAGAEPAIVALVNDADDIALPCNLPLFHPKHVEKLLLHLRRTIRGQARAIALGDGNLNKDTGDYLPFTVKKGETVIFSSYAGTEIKIDGSEYLIMTEDDILGIVD